jgi:hypothetical protein
MAVTQINYNNSFFGERLEGGLDAVASDETLDQSFRINPAPKFRARLTKRDQQNSNPNNSNKFLDNLPELPQPNSNPETHSGHVYILCLQRRYAHVKHYIGMVKSESVFQYGIKGAMRHRLRRHRQGDGAALLDKVTAVGIVIRLGGLVKGGTNTETRKLEKKLKRRSDKSALCKFCRQKYLRDRAREYHANQGTAKKAKYIRHTRPRKSKASYLTSTPKATKPTPHQLSKLTGLPRSLAKFYQDRGFLNAYRQQPPMKSTNQPPVTHTSVSVTHNCPICHSTVTVADTSPFLCCWHCHNDLKWLREVAPTVESEDEAERLIRFRFPDADPLTVLDCVAKLDS